MLKSIQKTKESDQQLAERKLLELVADRDRGALTRLYEQYYERLFKFVFRLAQSHAQTEEIVNDIMLAVWRGAGNYRGDSKPSTWIFGIAYRQTLKRLSRKQIKTSSRVDVEQISDNSVHTIEQEDWVRRGLDELPTAQRMAVELVFYLGLSYEEVAAVTECPVNTVKTRMFHARRKLKEKLKIAAAPTVSGEQQ